MEQLKFALGPYEIFASAVGGFPLVLAIFLICNSPNRLQDVLLTAKIHLSTPVVIFMVFFSYILGGSIQSITWRYFLLGCKIFRQDHNYSFGKVVSEKNIRLSASDEFQASSALQLEDRLVILLREKVGIPKKMDWLNDRLSAYLRECNSQAVTTAESYMASHIMYRNMSFGFLTLSIAIFVNIFQLRLFLLDEFVLAYCALFFACITFFRSISFKRWHGRELLLGFYFSACKQ